jgi:four helix bundle protein
MGFALNYKSMETYKLSREISFEIFCLTKLFPTEEKYSLTDQIRRAARSVGAQIAESWGKRRYEKHFVSKLTDADAEQFEVQHWLGVSLECGYILQEQHDVLIGKCESLNRMINNMIQKSSQFCK